MKRANLVAARIAIATALVLDSSSAFASVKLEGAWPDTDKLISIDASGLSRSDAVKRVADAAGWNVVVHAPASDPVDLHLKNVPATKVLELVLDDANYTATRDGTLVSIQRIAADAAAPASSANVAPAPTETAITPPPVPPPPAVDSAVPPVPPAPALTTSAATPAATKRGHDQTVTGGHVDIEASDTVKDLTVIGGSVDVYGNVTGDLTVLGGAARVHKDGHVHGDATAVGGTLDVDEGSTVDGDVGVIGGILNRAPGATIHGEVVGGHGKKDFKIKLGDDHEPGQAPGFSIDRTMSSIGGALTRSAILFVFGAMLLALATDRMERLRLEIAARPMRSLALGVVGGLAGGLSLIVLCVTIIGIPIAVVASLVLVFAGYAGFCAALATLGQGIFGHKTKNPYVQLALACVVFLLVSSIPFVGGWFTAACALVGLGAVVATRGAGL